MRLIVLGFTALLVLAPAARADDSAKDKTKQEATPDAQLEAIKAELDKALRTARQSIQEASTSEEENKIRKEFGKKVPEFMGKMLDVAEKYPKDKAAMDALRIVLTNVTGGALLERATKLILKERVNDPAIGLLVEAVVGRNPAVEGLIKSLMEKSTNNTVLAYATYGQAQILLSKANEAKPAESVKYSKEAEELLDRVIAKYKAPRELAEKAKNDLYVLQNFAIGKVAPDIVGEDSDGKKFKLSDYRGKVVVLDFWAEW